MKHIQVVLNLPELKVTKPSNTMCERCLRAILKELPALIITLHSLYEDSGDAVASLVLHSTVLDILAKFNCFMQRKATDFGRLPIVIQSILAELKDLKDLKESADWCSWVQTTTTDLTNKHGITLSTNCTRSGSAEFPSIDDFKKYVAHSYLEKLVSNIESGFSDTVVKLLVSSSVFIFPTDETALADYGNEKFWFLRNGRN